MASALGIELAGSGRTEEALRAGRRSVEVVPVAEDAVDSTDLLHVLEAGTP